MVLYYNSSMKKSSAPRIFTNINVRFPPEMVEAMKELARQDTRSLNGEIIWALQAFIMEHSTNQESNRHEHQDRKDDDNS